MFGDNESVVNTASMPHGKLHKRHNALAFHKTRECIAARIFRYLHTPGPTNPADILSKHWDMPSVWAVLQPLMFRYRNSKDGSKTSGPTPSNGSETTGFKPSSYDETNREALMAAPTGLLLLSRDLLEGSDKGTSSVAGTTSPVSPDSRSPIPNGEVGATSADAHPPERPND